MSEPGEGRFPTPKQTYPPAYAWHYCRNALMEDCIHVQNSIRATTYGASFVNRRWPNRYNGRDRDADIYTDRNGQLTEVACVDVPPRQKRAEFGCFNIGTATELQFPEKEVYWHLYTFGTRKAAETARSLAGIVVEEDGRVWLSEFGSYDAATRGGEAVAIIGPLQLPVAESYDAVLSYAVMRPGDSSRVHTHAGPEGWYVLAGQQCLETPAGASRVQAGQTMTAPPNVPMELKVTGTTVRRAFALVIHDSKQARGTPSEWKPLGKCDL